MIKGRKIREIPLYRLMPNFITLLGLCLGVTAIRYAIDYKWTTAVSLILLAGLLDGLDGRLARMLNSSSKFGAQLDSLADVISFGVSPAVVLYLWSLHDIPVKGVGWSVVLFFIICSVLRLARFNTAIDDEELKEESLNYFIGLPIPSAAAISLLPLVLTFELCDKFMFSYFFVAPYMLLIGFLMISRIPHFSFKKVSIRSEFVAFLMIAIAMLIAGIILEPWKILPFVGLAYLGSVPISTYVYWKKYSKCR